MFIPTYVSTSFTETRINGLSSGRLRFESIRFRFRLNQMLLATLLAVFLLSTCSSALFNPFGQFSLLPSIPRQFDVSWSICGNPEEHRLRVDEIVVTPSNPQVGKDVSVAVKGYTNQLIDGGKIVANIRIGVIKLEKQFDLCQSLDDISSSSRCPIPIGDLAISTVQAIPKEIPPVAVKSTLQISGADGGIITCVELNLKLSRQ